GKQVVKLPLTVRDDPNLTRFQGRKCIGSYEYDDEGTRAKDALLIERGVLRDFLTTRAQDRVGHKPNGHARTKKHQRPISRMGVTIIDGGDVAVSLKDLRSELIRLIREQRKPFGMIVYETSGGETDTTSYDFQGFSGEISHAALVYPNGKEVLIRGVDFVGTPLQALNNIVGVSKERELQNGYCGAESGFLPISTISPGLLISNLELQSKSEELVTPFILPRPILTKDE
ncbi:MAG: hypothetical protein KDD53_08670, partial [Bdellovibrionales bacterium]|nr:hypothetical protein [Bdellovibrionales bacterium]